jgi:hypothetical protein
MFTRFYSHPMAWALAAIATLVVLATLERMSGTEGAYAMLSRVGEQVSQQVVVVGHRVAQQVIVVGHKLKGG